MIVEGVGAKPESEEAKIKAAFETSPTRPIDGPFGYTSLQIRHQGTLYKVGIARTTEELSNVQALDRESFGQRRNITTEELANNSNNGYVLTLKDPAGKLIAESQILLSPTPEFPSMTLYEARCAGIAVKPGEKGKGYAQVMMKAQEVIAREAKKQRMTLSVPLENAESIRIREAAGFRIVGYEQDADGVGNFIMVKDFGKKPLPANPDKQAERVNDGNIPTIRTFDDLQRYEDKRKVDEGEMKTDSFPTREVGIPIRISGEQDVYARDLAAALLRRGYQGVGILRPDEYNAVDGKSLLIFQTHEGLLPVEYPRLPFHVDSDYGKLREVVLSNTPNFIGNKYNGNNGVSAAVGDTVNPVEYWDEHHALVKALEKEGVRVVRSSAFHPEIDRTGVFTRDPAVVIDDKIVVSRMFRENRQYETAAMRALAKGRDIVEIQDQSANIEGGDVIVLDKDLVIVGINERTNEAGFNALVDNFRGSGREFIGVRHQDLHLDVIFTVLGKKLLLADTKLLPSDFIDELRRRGYTIVEAAHEEQKPLGCNVLAIDDRKVIAVAENSVTNQRLRDAGVEVIEVSMPNIIKEGGGPRCLTCPTNRE